MKAEYITVHNTANDASASSEISYMNSNDNQVSYHFAVDDKEAVQGLLLDRNGWHCGDGNGDGNRKSIGVEICYSKSGGERYYKAEKNTIKLVAQLLKERGWGVDRVRTHSSWSKKNCPHRILDEGRWSSFLNEIVKELNQQVTQLSNPVVKNGWVKSGTNWLYYEKGVLVKSKWIKHKEEWYYIKADGNMATDWVQINAKWYYLEESGVMQTDWVKVKNKWYYLEPSGAMLANTCRSIKDKWYCFEASGAMIEGSVPIDKNGALTLK